MPAQKAKCSKCNRTKRRGLFHRDRSKKSGLSSYCKACKKKSDSKRVGNYGDRDNDGNYLYTVYYLPEEHYVGMTKDLMQRMRDHKKKGKIVEGYEVVARFTSAKQAHLMETRLHIMGYHGFHYTA